MTHSLADRLKDDQFAGYAYAYPHKTSYRPLRPPVRLSKAWREEQKDSLFLYIHLPFCEMRCGFCNLFTTVQPNESFVAQTLTAIGRQSKAAAGEIEPQSISQLALGGGTPSFLTAKELESLFQSLSQSWPIDWKRAGSSFETSPATVTAEKLALLKEYHIDRISMGVQSFSPADLKRLGRPQSSLEVERAVAAIQAAEFPVFNLDLIYGAEGQTEQNWLQSVERTIEISPQEIYLYPLYVRKLTALGLKGKSPAAWRHELLLSARGALLATGYEQCSMRLFRRENAAASADYCCQEDGMIGLGPGARSYTRALHYSSEYAVGQNGVKRIIADFNSRPAESFACADYGVHLNANEQRRRYLIKSLLRAPGLELAAYQNRFGSEAEDDFPELAELFQLELAETDGRTLQLTSQGLCYSDVIGPWLYSSEVTASMEAYELA